MAEVSENDIRNMVQSATNEGRASARHHERVAVLCWLSDRAAQYDESSRYRAFVEELCTGIIEGRHIECLDAGEYDDVRPWAERAAAGQ